MSNKILLVIDMQKGFETPSVILLANKIRRYINIEKPNEVIFTQFVNSKNSNFIKRLNYSKMIDTESTDLIDLFFNFPNKIVFIKDTYSIFKNKDFLKYINKKKDFCLQICGIDTDACVLATAFDCFDLNYDFEILEYLICSTEKNMDKAGKKIINRNLKFKKEF